MNQKTLTMILIFNFILGCGVKGKPLPPLEPVQLGSGEYQPQNEEQQKKKAQQ